MDILYWQSVLLGTSHYEILVPRIRLEPVVDRIAIGNIRLNLDVLSIRGPHPHTLVMVTQSQTRRAIQGRFFGGRNFIDYVRIGLSATQKPIEEVARFLVGTTGVGANTPVIIDSGHRRARDLALEVPDSPLEAVMSAEVWDQLYQRLAATPTGTLSATYSKKTRLIMATTPS